MSTKPRAQGTAQLPKRQQERLQNIDVVLTQPVLAASLKLVAGAVGASGGLVLSEFRYRLSPRFLCQEVVDEERMIARGATTDL